MLWLIIAKVFINIKIIKHMAAAIISDNTELTQKVIDVLKTIYDPEIPVDIWELGLIYEVKVNAQAGSSGYYDTYFPFVPSCRDITTRNRGKIEKYRWS